MSGIGRQLQECAARALPAEWVEDADGWWLRHAPGCMWWVRTVLPHQDAVLEELPHRIMVAEKFYADRGAAMRVQITPGAGPGGLDGFLADRGYRKESPMSLRGADIADVIAADEPAMAGTTSMRIEVTDRPTRAWFDVWHRVNGGDARAEWDLLLRVAPPCGYAHAISGDEVVGVGRVVVDGGWAGVFGLATLPRARGRGAARRVLAGLADWAAAHRASRAYLQVERDNARALRLYEAAGFTEICGYHYRANPT